jgi:hypothetical protein
VPVMVKAREAVKARANAVDRVTAAARAVAVPTVPLVTDIYSLSAASRV